MLTPFTGDQCIDVDPLAGDQCIDVDPVAGDLVPRDDEAAGGGQGAQLQHREPVQPQPGGGGPAGLRHLLLQGRELPPEGDLGHPTDIR